MFKSEEVLFFVRNVKYSRGIKTVKYANLEASVLMPLFIDSLVFGAYLSRIICLVTV